MKINTLKCTMIQQPIYPCGWHGTLSQFLSTELHVFLKSLTSHHESCMLMNPGQNQLYAWQNSYDALQENLEKISLYFPASLSWTLIFEYELPRERGRRPDLVLLAGSQIFVIEFKDFSIPLQAHIDQVAAYARDIRHYQEASHDREVIPFLILTQASAIVDQRYSVFIHSPDTLSNRLLSLNIPYSSNPINPETWLNADYAPLPSLVSAARRIFQHDPLPYIRRAHSAGIPQTISKLLDIAQNARSSKQHHIALVTGVPGAGKTLVGLQFVYSDHFNDQGSSRTSIFLSGNSPLVKVLQHALKSSVFVQDVHGFLRQYGGHSPRIPEEHIFVFDEAQRAWDSARVKEKRGHDRSEPQDFLHIGEKKSWSLMVGLIGDGQEIHLGEEAGLEQWNTAVAYTNTSWYVHCPNRVAHLFTAANQVKTTEVLDLTSSLRSHLAEDVQVWVKQLLIGDLAGASQTANNVRRHGFDMYITQDLAIAKSYLRHRYEGQEEKRFGILASSKSKNLDRYGVRNGYQFTKNLKEGPWYNDPPHSKYSCCQLDEVATEFACQGLELDFPLICWGNDLRWHNHRWISSQTSRRSKARNPHQLRLNSYRVLLSRGRDGFIIFVPPEPEMENSYKSLLQAGARPLDQ
jgi:hypothetical protein